MTDLVPAAAPDLVVAPAPPSPDRHPVAVYLARLGSPRARRTQAQALEAIARVLLGKPVAARRGRPRGDDPAHDRTPWRLALPWHALGYQHTHAVRAALAARYAPATANKALCALRGVLQEAWRLGLMSAEAYHRARDLPAVAGTRLPAGRALELGEIGALLGACDPATPGGTRDAALVAVLYTAGLRRSELVALDLADFDPRAESLRVLGKGNKQRSVYVTGDARRALDAWLARRGTAPGPLFAPLSKTGRMLPRRLSDQAVRVVLHRLADRAAAPKASPHDLRRTFISERLDAGVDLLTVQAIVGHARPETTARYDRRGERRKRDAVAGIRLPLRG